MNRSHTAISIRNDELLKERHPLSSCFDQVSLWQHRPANEIEIAPVCDFSSLKKTLLQFKEKLLVPVELPAIYQSFQSAQEYDFESIGKLDADLQQQIFSIDFARASQEAGRLQLKRLRPLKDHRLTQKYLASMERSEVHGWHTIVYGISLDIYSIPVRQGLVNYASHTLSTLIECGAEKISLEPSASNTLYDQLIATIPAVVDGLLPDFSESDLRVI